MNSQPENYENRQTSMRPNEKEVSVFDLVAILTRRVRTIVVFPIIAAVASAGITLLLPEIYQANTTLLPPQQSQSSTSAMLSQLGGVAGLAGLGGGKSPSDVYLGMLQSRTVADRLVEKFDLKKVYGTTSQDQARQRLAGNTNVRLEKDGLISIEVTGTDKKLVAPLANAYVDELTQLNKVLAVSEAGQRRIFYERQLGQAKNNLAKAEASLKGSLDSRGVISVDAESQAVLETVGRVKAQVSAKEIELNSMTAFVTPSNPQYMRVQEQLSSLRAELSRLENGRSADSAKDASVSPGQKNGFDNIQLLRDVKYYQMLYEILAKQYEAARLDEAKDPSLIQVLDPAIEPERKFKPHRLLIVMLSGMIAFAAAIAWVFVSEAYRKILRSEEGASQLAEIKTNLRFK